MIGYTPLQPSNLRISTGPSSPASPLSPPPLTARSLMLSPISTDTSDYPSLPSPAPPSPLPWRWYCHKCHKHYPLGATSRCLHDGHAICFYPSEKLSKRTGNLKFEQPCTTEFDYGGWRAWNEWRRRNFPSRATQHKHRTRDCCSKCDYPSQCTHSNSSTPVIEPLFNPPVVNDPTSPAVSRGPCVTFEQLLGPPAPATPSTSPAAGSKRASTALDRFVKAAETHSAQWAALLSPIHETLHDSQPKPKTTKTTPPVPDAVVTRRRPSSTRTTPGSKHTQRKAPATNEIPSPAAAEDFQSFKARMDRIHGSSGVDRLPNPAPESPSPGPQGTMLAPLRVVIPPQQQLGRTLGTSPHSAIEFLALASMESAFGFGLHQSKGHKTRPKADTEERQKAPADKGEIDMAGSTTSKSTGKKKKKSSRGRRG